MKDFQYLGAFAPLRLCVKSLLDCYGLSRLVLLLTGSLLGVVAAKAATLRYEPANIIPPQPMREFRGAWIATVKNIDWPSKPGLSTAQQKKELLDLLDRATELNLNAVIFQVRPQCDALYDSKIEPWSEYLTGKMGKPPEPFYDPLAFAIKEAHKRGLELHAWFNPYRALHSSHTGPIAPNHVSRTHPGLVRKFGNQLWLDPGERDVQDYSLSVVMDVVKRYDVDGVHFDDYFYPYPQDGSDFPDEASWRKYGVHSGLSRADWRRANVNAFIERTYHSIKAVKPWVKFGISPFGIWRPKNPPQIQGMDAYEKIFADSRKWLANGWVDYFAPQLYWAIEPAKQSFPALLKWWVSQNVKGRHLWPGLNTAKANGDWPTDEIINQIKLTRKQAGADGDIHWNMSALMNNPALAAKLEYGVYAEPALIPAFTWLSKGTPGKPSVSTSIATRPERLHIVWSAGKGEKPSRWVVQLRRGGSWKTEITADSERTVEGAPPDTIAVTAVDRYGNMGPPTVLLRQEGRTRRGSKRP